MCLSFVSRLCRFNSRRLIRQTCTKYDHPNAFTRHGAFSFFHAQIIHVPKNAVHSESWTTFHSSCVLNDKYSFEARSKHGSIYIRLIAIRLIGTQHTNIIRLKFGVTQISIHKTCMKALEYWPHGVLKCKSHLKAFHTNRSIVTMAMAFKKSFNSGIFLFSGQFIANIKSSWFAITIISKTIFI